MAANGDDEKSLMIIIVMAGRVRLTLGSVLGLHSDVFQQGHKDQRQHGTLQGSWLSQRPFSDPEHISWLSFLWVTCETHIFLKGLDSEDLDRNRESESKSGTDPVGPIPKHPDRLKLFTLNTSKQERHGWTRKSFPCLPNAKWQGGYRFKIIIL